MRRYDCDLCEKSVLDISIIRIGHFFKDVFFMCLFLLKMMTWTCFQSFKLGKLKYFPCECGHIGFWHVVTLKNDPFMPLSPISWFYLFFRYKFSRNDAAPLGECVKCIFNVKKEEYDRCFEFKPLNNLIYLENLYKNK